MHPQGASNEVLALFSLSSIFLMVNQGSLERLKKGAKQSNLN